MVPNYGGRVVKWGEDGPVRGDEMMTGEMMTGQMVKRST